MKIRSTIAAAIVSTAALAAQAATTTTYYFCTTGSVSYTENRASATSSGWSQISLGSDAELKTTGCPYTYPAKMNNGTSLVSPTCPEGSYITSVVVGARVSNVARAVVVTPSSGSAQTKALNNTGVLEEVSFSFPASDAVSSVTIATPSGTGNSYVYYVTITTETTSSSGGGGDTPVGPVRATIFEENFTSQDNSWGSSSANLAPLTGGTFNCDESDWTGILVGARRSCAAVGTKEVSGYAQTRSILLANNATSGSASVSFYAVTPTATTSRKVVTVHVFAIDADTGATNWHSSVEAPKLSSTSVTDITAQDGQSLSATVQNLPERFFLRFEPDSAINEKQFAIDAVKVTQVYNPNLTPLAAPVATVGEATITSLAFSWGAVADATGYAVELRDGSGARVAYDAAVIGTATNFTNLDWDSDYTIRVKALGDDSIYCNSPWSADVTSRTLQNLDAPAFSASADASAPVMAVVSNKTFSVSAERDGESLEVAFDGLSPAAADATPTFSSGTFSWTPAAGDEGKTFTATFTTDSGTFSTNIVFNVLARPDLVEPVISVSEISFNAASAAWDSPWQIRASSYSYRLWSGSDTASDADTDCEHFHDRVVPGGWTLSGTTWQPSSDYNATPVAMIHEGDYVVSKLYDAPVTTLSFRLRRPRKADTPVVKFYASTGADRESVWNEVSIGEQDADSTNTDYLLEFSQSSNYRRFKWVYYEKHSNVNLGSIVAKYEGAGAKFKAGSASALVDAPSDNVLNLTELRPETNYFLEVRVEDENGTEKSSTVRFSTLVAPKYTLMVLK